MQINKQVIVKEAQDWIKTIVIYILIALLIRFFILNLSIVPTGSMIPTIQINDKIVVLKFNYWFFPVKRGDIIVFHSPHEKNVQLVKRVVGMGGETILIKDGKLYINGKLHLEPYIYEKMNEDFGPYEIPEYGYFVMGDNRNNSYDCRKWDQKYITKDMIIGKAVYKFGALK
ncbi:MAG: signal peptidase [Clostridiales bacterium]|jgi:signal peptidase I|nr:signal peptidase [Clostridiales bacterium]MDK2932237.1 signal peptidase [Clostridiales bacterium]